jgi:hypothetical protein
MELGKIFIILGIFFLAIGVTTIFFKNLSLGNLPGDIVIQKENFSFHFPIVTSLLISVLLSLLFWVMSRFLN